MVHTSNYLYLILQLMRDVAPHDRDFFWHLAIKNGEKSKNCQFVRIDFSKRAPIEKDAEIINNAFISFLIRPN